MKSVQFTVGKIDAGIAILLTEDHHLIEFPSLLLPTDVEKNGIVNVTVSRNEQLEENRMAQFWQLQHTIRAIFGTDEPKTPVIKITNITQTSLIIKWEHLILHKAKLRSLDIYKNGTKLSQHVPRDLNYIKLSGLDIDHEYEFYIVMKTTNGKYESNIVTIRTHTLDDLTGICVTFGTFNKGSDITQIKQLVEKMGVPHTQEISVITTHVIAEVSGGSNYDYAVQYSIPIVKPEWISQCDRNKRMQPVGPYYTDNIYVANSNYSNS